MYGKKEKNPHGFANEMPSVQKMKNMDGKGETINGGEEEGKGGEGGEGVENLFCQSLHVS